MKRVGICEIQQIDPTTLAITWSDGAVSHYDVVELRRLCPCAWCSEGRKKERQKKEQGCSLDHVRPLSLHSVGRYALKILWDDGHSHGIYTFAYLRQLAKLP